MRDTAKLENDTLKPEKQEEKEKVELELEQARHREQRLLAQNKAKERKARTRRLIVRDAMLESVIEKPALIHHKTVVCVLSDKPRGGNRMAIYHFSVQVISRGAGKSVLAAAAYRSGEKLQDDYYGLVHDYSRKQNIVHKKVLLPANAWV